MTLPTPLPLEEEQLVIVEIIDGIADTTTVHLPAARIVNVGRGGPTFDQYDFPPAHWPSACRQIPSGSVYLRAGPLADTPICEECLAS